MKKLIVSFSGGETSAFMAYWLKKYRSNIYDMIFVFANTGEENEETLIFADKCDKEFKLNLVWLEAVVNPEQGKGIRHKIVNYKTASRKGEPFKAIIEKYSIPNRNAPFCSERLKKDVIRSYARSLGLKKKQYQTAIGIREDEVDRVSSKKDIERLIYPLITHIPMTKERINLFWKQMPFRLDLKGYEGNCKVCWKKSLRKLLTIARDNPERFEFVSQMEKEYENFVPEKVKRNPNVKPPMRFFRGNLTSQDILEMAEKPFEQAIDDSENYYIQTNLFGHPLDQSNGCEESCEAF